MPSPRTATPTMLSCAASCGPACATRKRSTWKPARFCSSSSSTPGTWTASALCWRSSDRACREATARWTLISADRDRPGTYIELIAFPLADGSDPAAESRQAAGSHGQVSHVFASGFHGFAAELPDPAIAALQRNPNVTAIEPDGVVSVTDTQSGAPWGLDRIDQQALPLSGSYNFPAGPGAGVTAYILDTGVAPAPRPHPPAAPGGGVTAPLPAPGGPPAADLDQRWSGYDVITPSGDGSGDCNGH